MKRTSVLSVFASLPLMLGVGILSVTVAGCISHEPATELLPEKHVLLPNGWSLSPVGQHLPLGELPLNIAVTPDGKTAVVTNNGTGDQSLSVIDLADWKVRSVLPLNRSWLGLDVDPQGTSVFVSAGNDNAVLRFSLGGNDVFLRDSIPLDVPWPRARVWAAGLTVTPNGKWVFVVSRENHRLYRINLDARIVDDELDLPAIPYTCLASHDGKKIFVSLWGGARVAVVDPDEMMITDTVSTGDHPCDMVESPDGARLFVACANTNSVSVIDVHHGTVIERLNSALFPEAPEGSTPNSVALSGDGNTLLIANADNNCLAVFNVRDPGRSRSLGFIPTGWYPTCVRFQPGTGNILVASAKGFSSRPNPHGPQPAKRYDEAEYIGRMFKGVLSRLRMPDQTLLDEYTRMVYDNSPLHTTNPAPDSGLGLWTAVDHPSPIKHVFYVIKENRTYDQVFGDLPEGNGDPNLCLFPDSITPNLHALVREFTLFDHLYCDAEVSADGHNWSMGAYATDYTEKSWPTSYGGRGGAYEYEGGYPIVYPSAGYLWDECRRNGITYRTYGEFVRNPAHSGDSAQGLTPALVGHAAPFYRGWDLEYSDVRRIQAWEEEFSRYEQNGMLPQFQVIKLPNDHTEGTTAGALTPRAYVAQNDLALGMLVDRISHSRYWKESIIFVIEDDAQNGPDHIDAHRTEGLMISPYTRRHFVDSHPYSTSSMIRTLELILGLPPLSQFDASARPMSASLMPEPDLTPFVHRPAHLDLEERNPQGALGQRESGTMDFSREDAAPEQLLNSILWTSVKGPGVPMPSPVRSAFVRGPVRDDD
jgi:DNA-binding beta-propeller fold protein YncE